MTAGRVVSTVSSEGGSPLKELRLSFLGLGQGLAAPELAAEFFLLLMVVVGPGLFRTDFGIPGEILSLSPPCGLGILWDRGIRDRAPEEQSCGELLGMLAACLEESAEVNVDEESEDEDGNEEGDDFSLPPAACDADVHNGDDDDDADDGDVVVWAFLDLRSVSLVSEERRMCPDRRVADWGEDTLDAAAMLPPTDVLLEWWLKDEERTADEEDDDCDEDNIEDDDEGEVVVMEGVEANGCG